MIVTIGDKKFDTLIPGQQVSQRIKLLASQITENYEGLDPLMIGVLNGAYLFFAELTKNVGFEMEVAFTRYQSYVGTQSTGQFKVTLPLPEKLKGRHLILVEDIIDTGATLERIIKDACAMEPASLEVAAMLIKPEVFKNRFPVKYTGFEISNKFVIGYGLDFDGRGRNLSDIMVLSD